MTTSRLIGLALLSATATVAMASMTATAKAQAFTDFGISAGEGELLGGGTDIEVRRGVARIDGFSGDLLRVGGSIRPVPDLEITATPRNRYRSVGRSVLVAVPQPSIALIRGTGVYANARGSGRGSFLHYGSPPESVQEGGPKIIDVAAELGRHSKAPGAVSVEWSGSTKIIRIASADTVHPLLGKDEHGPEHFTENERREAAEPPVPTPTPGERPAEAEVEAGEPPSTQSAQDAPSRPVPPAPEPQRADPAAEDASEPAADAVDEVPSETEAGTAPAEAGVFLEPWTDEWLESCVARYENFDSSLGTYLDENGQRRFCTGEAG